MKCLWALPLLCLLFASCGMNTTEPEQLYLVSAIGFDAAEEGVCVVAEVPLTRETEADKMDVCVFQGVGQNIPDALDQMKKGLGKRLFFGHCALAVLGDGMEADRLRAALDFLADEEIPLSITVVSAPNARELLARGSLSAPAAGYEIPDILRLQTREAGLFLQCRYYEIAARGSDFTIPRFEPNAPERAEADRFCGLRTFREGRAVTE
ncbi:MAG: hypothetical protein II955_03695 [Clostridia bacterium]|nr:hypothetical protein [Clostridia bacterium]